MTKQMWYVLIITLGVNLLFTCEQGVMIQEIQKSIKHIEQILEVE